MFIHDFQGRDRQLDGQSFSLSECTLHEARRAPNVSPGPVSGEVFVCKHNRHWTISGKKGVERRHALLEGRRKCRGSTQGLETRLGPDETWPFLKVLVTEATAKPHHGVFQYKL